MGRFGFLCGVMGLLWAGCAVAQPEPLRGVTLRDQQAQLLQARALSGRVVLLHFVYTGCSATCPTQVKELAALRDALAPAVRDAVSFVSVSLDPHDGPREMAAFARRLDALRTGWVFASGREAELARLAGRLQAFDPARATPALADHRTSLFVFDGRGELVQRFAGVPVDRPRLQRELTQLALNLPPLPRRSGP